MANLTGHIVEVWRRADRSVRARILLPTALLFTATLTLMVVSAVEIFGLPVDGAPPLAR